MEVAAYLNLSPQKLEVVPEGPYIGWYPEGENRETARKKLGIGETERVWLYLGTLRPYKGVEALMDAFGKLAGPGSVLLIAGNPWNKAYSEELLQKAKGNPGIRIFAKSIPDGELQTFFGAADLVVLPFRHVLNSGSVLLAMGFGKAVVAPRMGLIPFRLSAQPQLLFDEEIPLESVLESTLKMSPEELEAIGQKNRQQALKYSWEDFATFVLEKL
jgi:glycosyltransferase involved in cell wall biosynthesis